MRSLFPALILLVAATASSASAQTVADKADARCVMVLTAVSRDPKATAKAQQGMFYYLGKLEARGASPKLEGMMSSEARLVNTQALLQTELTRCGAELNRRDVALRAMFQRLQATAKAAQPPPAITTPPAK